MLGPQHQAPFEIRLIWLSLMFALLTKLYVECICQWLSLWFVIRNLAGLISPPSVWLPCCGLAFVPSTTIPKLDNCLTLDFTISVKYNAKRTKQQNGKQNIMLTKKSNRLRSEKVLLTKLRPTWVREMPAYLRVDKNCNYCTLSQSILKAKFSCKFRWFDYPDSVHMMLLEFSNVTERSGPLC